MNKKIAAAMLTLLLPLSLAAQEQPKAAQQTAPPKPEAQLRAIARLGMMLGEWRGEGWVDFGQGKLRFRGGETVKKKLDGVALVVEGAFFSRRPGSDLEYPIHTTLGVISFDPAAKNYRFATWLASGSSGVYELTLSADEKGWQWALDVPDFGTTRYIATFRDGEWFEIGERSKDGKEWKQFFEMRLKKK